jgi:hypothetical protein
VTAPTGITWSGVTRSQLIARIAFRATSGVDWCIGGWPTESMNWSRPAMAVSRGMPRILAHRFPAAETGP